MSKVKVTYTTVSKEVALTIGSKTYNPEISLPLVEITERSSALIDPKQTERYLASFRVDTLWDMLANYLSKQCGHDDLGTQRRAKEAKAVLELRTQAYDELRKRTQSNRI